MKIFVALGKHRSGSLGMPLVSQGWQKEQFSHDSKLDRHQGQWWLLRGTSSYKELERDEQ